MTRETVNKIHFALIRRCGGTFSLRAKSRLRRLRYDTRLRAQPLGGRQENYDKRSAYPKG